jgi:hypothetical protein
MFCFQKKNCDLRNWSPLDQPPSQHSSLKSYKMFARAITRRCHTLSSQVFAASRAAPFVRASTSATTLARRAPIAYTRSFQTSSAIRNDKPVVNAPTGESIAALKKSVQVKQLSSMFFFFFNTRYISLQFHIFIIFSILNRCFYSISIDFGFEI